jgi:formylglycine-generating enzyme
LQTLQPEYSLRLPTEAEWGYARRAETQTLFSFDGVVSLDKVNYRGTWEYKSNEWNKGALQATTEVKSYLCNAWGLNEMHGNVWEWCQDNWTEQLSKGAVIDPIGLNTGSARVVRDGSLNYYGRGVRSVSRNYRTPGNRSLSIGFRFALGLELRSG